MNSNSWIILLLGAALVAVSIRLAISVNSGSKDSAAAMSDSQAALENIMTRASVREYTDSVVPDSVVEKILRAGMAAPTAANRQPWHFFVIENQAVKDSIASAFKYAKMVSGSAFDVVVCGNTNLIFTGDTPVRGNWVLDCSAATENMLLAAHALGIGGVWCGIYPEDDRVADLTRILSLPDTLVPLNVVSFGYPKKTVVPKDKWDATKVDYIR